MSRLDCSLITGEDGFSSIRSEWEALFSRAQDANPFLSHDWLHSWWRCYAPDARLRIWLARDEDMKLVGVAPMMLVRKWYYGLPLRVLQFIGDGTWETDHMNILVDQERLIPVVAEIARNIVSESCDLIDLNQLPEESRITEALLGALPTKWHARAERVPCPYTAIPATSDVLLRDLPSRLRTSIRSSLRKLRERYEVTLHVASGTDVEPTLQSLFSKHASRWQGKGQSGVFTNQTKRDFYREVASRFDARGWLRLFSLSLDARLVAHQFCFEYRDRVYLLQEGFDFDLAKENVGNVLRYLVFEHLMSQGNKTYDFLAGTSRHKAAWASGTAYDLRTEYVRPTFSGSAYRLAKRVASRLQRDLQPPPAGVEAEGGV